MNQIVHRGGLRACYHPAARARDGRPHRADHRHAGGGGVTRRRRRSPVFAAWLAALVRGPVSLRLVIITKIKS
jgi:hypothetical protein